MFLLFTYDVLLVNDRIETVPVDPEIFWKVALIVMISAEKLYKSLSRLGTHSVMQSPLAKPFITAWDVHNPYYWCASVVFDLALVRNI